MSAIDRETFSTTVFKAKHCLWKGNIHLVWIIATTTKICTLWGSDWALHPNFNASIDIPPTRPGPWGVKPRRFERSLTNISFVHFQGNFIRLVSCYTLLGGFRLPWPPSNCLNELTPFMVSIKLAFWNFSQQLTVHPTLPDLLTKSCPPKTISIFEANSNPGLCNCASEIALIVHLEFENRMKSLNSKTANHLLYQTLLISFCYPERYFGGNQLLGCSMSLSPLYSTLTSDLHVSTVRRSSIKVSFDFYHVKYRSQPFGSCHLCLRAWLEDDISCVSCILVRRTLYMSYTFISHYWRFNAQHLHKRQIPWSVFQDGTWTKHLIWTIQKWQTPFCYFEHFT